MSISVWFNIETSARMVGDCPLTILDQASTEAFVQTAPFALEVTQA